jgi:hypothetical protein
MSPRPIAYRCARAALLPALLALSACGGASDTLPSAVPPPLFDDAGRVQAFGTEARPGVPTATEEQLRWQELVSSPTTVVFDLDALGGPAALAQAQVAQAFKPLPGTVWFVRGGTPQEAAGVVDALRQQGLELVFQVY